MFINGFNIIDRQNSHLHGSVIPVLEEALNKVNLGANFIAEEIEMGRVVGYSDCVPTSSQDIIQMIVRPGRKGASRVVFGREPIATTKVFVVLKKVGVNTYVLITAFVGAKAGLEPWDPRATEADVEFWKTHALRYESIWD